MSDDVTLYIPCYNAAQYLPEVIQGVMAQTHPIREVLIIDDASRDDSVDVISRLTGECRYPVRLLRQSENQGLSAARNWAVQECKTPYLASIDADVALAPDWLEQLIGAMGRFDNLAGVGGKLVERYTEEIADFWRSTHLVQHRGDAESLDIPFLFGCNNIYLTEAIRAAGGYDPSLRTNGEDHDISIKIKSLGYQLLYTPAATCEHLRRDTVPSIFNTIWRYNYFGGQLQRKGLLRHLLSPAANFVFLFRLLRRDLARGNVVNLGLDLACCPFLIYRDIKAYIQRLV